MILLVTAALAAAVPADARPTIPGATNPAVTQENIATTICVRGWTPTVRPPRFAMLAVKRRLMRAAGETNYHRFELDHDIPLELGGSPDSPDNLWLERWAGRWGAHTKDRLENLLHRLVCSGALPLADAQREIATDWVASYRARVRR